jgi:fatty-acyl-CoA synthase
MRGPSLQPPAALTLDLALDRAAAGPDGLIFVGLDEREERLAWREVRERAGSTAAGLAGAGVSSGDRVSLLLPTCPAFVTAFFGCILAGAIPVPLYPPVRLGRLSEFIDATAALLAAVEARLVLTDGRLLPLLGQVAERARPALGFTTPAALDRDAPAPGIAPAAPGDPAVIQFSSGTTHHPQPIVLTHRNLTMQCAALKELLRPRDGATQVGVSWLPLYHDMGLIGGLLSAVTYPGSLVLIRPEHFLARPALWLRALSRHRATISAAPAFAFPFCARRIRDAELAGCDLASWRIAICGAEHVSSRGLQRFCRRFAAWGFDSLALMPAYGLAEASLAVTSRAAGAGHAILGVDPRRLAPGDAIAAGSHALVSCGPPLHGMEIEVREARGGAVLPERRCGRLFVRGPSLMAGYYHQPEATAAVLREGWLDTGDLGFVHEGEVYICGRAKDLIVVRGANHLPQEFEDCLLELDGVQQGRALAVGFQAPDADGEALLLLVEQDARAGSVDRAELARRVRRRILVQTGVQPHTVLILPRGSLPRTSSGKLRRAEALRRFLSGDLTPPGRVHTRSLAGHLLRSGLAFGRLRFGRLGFSLLRLSRFRFGR